VRAHKQTSTEPESVTLLTHVRELQIRLLITAAVLVAAGTAAWFFYGQILDLLRAPLNAPLYYNSVSGSFSFIMKICLVAGIAVSVPLIVYNFIMFVRPAFIGVFTLKRVILMTLGSVLAAATGMVFGFVFIIPGALHFFSGFQVHGLHEQISADSYLNFVINVLITFILMFQLPLVASLIDRIKPISPRALWKGEKWALIGSVIIALIVPFAMDFMTQLLIAAPIFLLYNFSFIVIGLQHSYDKRIKAKAAHVAARIARQHERRTLRPVHAKKIVPGTLICAPLTLQPHPQLTETFELLAHQSMPTAPSKAKPQPVVAKTPPVITKTHVMADMVGTVKPHPIIKPQPVVTVIKPAPEPVVDATPDQAPVLKAPVVEVATEPDRSQPANVIRGAGSISPAPERTGTFTRRPLNFMSDIR
jgi:sec-independent protein translocase protein TatC